MAREKEPPFKDSLGKRDVVINMMKAKRNLAEISIALGATREDLDTYYRDLIEKYQPAEYLPSDNDRMIVWRMAAFGMTQKQIASRLGISVSTLTYYYTRELDNAKQEWIDDIANNLTTIAKGGSAQAVSAGQFLLKTRAGWKETSVTEMTGKDGGPIQTEEMGAKERLRQALLLKKQQDASNSE